VLPSVASWHRRRRGGSRRADQVGSGPWTIDFVSSATSSRILLAYAPDSVIRGPAPGSSQAPCQNALRGRQWPATGARVHKVSNGPRAGPQRSPGGPESHRRWLPLPKDGEGQAHCDVDAGERCPRVLGRYREGRCRAAAVPCGRRGSAACAEGLLALLRKEVAGFRQHLSSSRRPSNRLARQDRQARIEQSQGPLRG
jgi:hypothetical protein